MSDTGIITKVVEGETGYDITQGGGWGFGLSKEYGVVPKVGDHVTIQRRGSIIRGVILNGQQLYYKTDADLDREHEEWKKDLLRKKEEEFLEKEEQLNTDYQNLPLEFRYRIDKFRMECDRINQDGGRAWRIEYEPYEMFCCTEAVKIAKAAKEQMLPTDDVEEINEWFIAFRDNHDRQKEQVPDLAYDEHSGNTFGCAASLANWYLVQPEGVVAMHGALTPLVGCDDYYCPHPDDPRNES